MHPQRYDSSEKESVMNPSRRILEMSILAFLLAAGASAAQRLQVAIESPAQGADVRLETVVKGRVSDPGAKVYVLVQPLRVGTWWVQRLPAPSNRDGSWQTLCYFGTVDAGVGEEFQIIAIVSRRKLKEGQRLTEIPKDAVHSDVVTVKRTP
jgi:hypothetical protein